MSRAQLNESQSGVFDLISIDGERGPSRNSSCESFKGWKSIGGSAKSVRPNYLQWLMNEQDATISDILRENLALRAEAKMKNDQIAALQFEVNRLAVELKKLT